MMLMILSLLLVLILAYLWAYRPNKAIVLREVPSAQSLLDLLPPAEYLASSPIFEYPEPLSNRVLQRYDRIRMNTFPRSSRFQYFESPCLRDFWRLKEISDQECNLESYSS